MPSTYKERGGTRSQRRQSAASCAVCKALSYLSKAQQTLKSRRRFMFNIPVLAMSIPCPFWGCALDEGGFRTHTHTHTHTHRERERERVEQYLRSWSSTACYIWGGILNLQTHSLERNVENPPLECRCSYPIESTRPKGAKDKCSPQAMPNFAGRKKKKDHQYYEASVNKVQHSALGRL